MLDPVDWQATKPGQSRLNDPPIDPRVLQNVNVTLSIIVTLSLPKGLKSSRKIPVRAPADSSRNEFREPLNKSLPPRRGKVRMGVTALIS